jgi:lysosomal acid lipase/cholesteryl ester hydrolase
MCQNIGILSELQKCRVNLTIIFYFSLDVMAQKDIPSQLQLVANETGKAGEIIYIGHSMGTTLIFMYASEYPEETRELIQGFVTLAPVAYLNGVPIIEFAKPLALLVIVSTVKYITLTNYFQKLCFQKMLDVINVRGILYQEKLIHRLFTSFCKNVTPTGCVQLINLFGGKSVQFAPVNFYYKMIRRNCKESILGGFAVVYE